MAGHFREEAFHALRVPECGRRRVRNNNFATCLETRAFLLPSLLLLSFLFSFLRSPFLFPVIFFFHGRLVESLVSSSRRWSAKTRRRIDLWFQRDSCARIIFESTVDRCEWKICARWKVCVWWMLGEKVDLDVRWNAGVEKGECLVTYVSPTGSARFSVIE